LEVSLRKTDHSETQKRSKAAKRKQVETFVTDARAKKKGTYAYGPGIALDEPREEASSASTLVTYL